MTSFTAVFQYLRFSASPESSTTNKLTPPPSLSYSYVAGVLLAPKLYRSYNPKPLLVLLLSVFILTSILFSFILTLSSNAVNWLVVKK